MSEPYDDPATDERQEGLEEEVDVEALKAQLEQKEQDIQKLKGHWGSEKQQLVERLAKLEGRVEERDAYSNSQREPEKDPFDLTEEDVERINNNPAEVVKLFKAASQKQMSAFVDALKARDEYYDSSLRETRSLAERVKKELDPERLPWKDTISELRKNEKLAQLDDDTLIEVAKMQGKGPAMEYRGAAGGGVNRGQQQKVAAFDPSSERGRAFLAVAQGDIEKAKKFYDSWARKQVQ
jgi:hypothetical protein